MDLNENIRIAAEVIANKNGNQSCKGLVQTQFDNGLYEGFIQGAKSQQAKEYWFAEFKREEVSELTPQEKIGFTCHDSRIGIVGYGRSLGCALQVDRYRKTELLRETIQSAKEQGVQVVVIGGFNTRSIQDIPQEIEAIRTQFDREPEVFKIYNYKMIDREIPLSIQEPKAWDRKTLPNKMNNYKSKKRNKR